MNLEVIEKKIEKQKNETENKQIAWLLIFPRNRHCYQSLSSRTVPNTKCFIVKVARFFNSCILKGLFQY